MENVFRVLNFEVQLIQMLDLRNICKLFPDSPSFRSMSFHSLVLFQMLALSSLYNLNTYVLLINYCSAFFSVPVHPDSRTFTFMKKSYRCNRLPHGFVDSPPVLSTIVQDLLGFTCQLPLSAT